jgi:hypothetical protein
MESDGCRASPPQGWILLEFISASSRGARRRLLTDYRKLAFSAMPKVRIVLAEISEQSTSR